MRPNFECLEKRLPLTGDNTNPMEPTILEPLVPLPPVTTNPSVVDTAINVSISAGLTTLLGPLIVIY